MDAQIDRKESSSKPLFREIHSQWISFDAEDFFTDFNDWSNEVFEILAEESGISLLPELHWQVVRFFRDYYAYNGRAPLNREVRDGISMSLLELERLFPGGIKKGARRLAGLPNPKTCN
jgi:tRNA 2-thiouridine synthesizing protein E